MSKQSISVFFSMYGGMLCNILVALFVGFSFDDKFQGLVAMNVAFIAMVMVDIGLYVRDLEIEASKTRRRSILGNRPR